ncbi:DNA repair protein RecN [Pseudoalteromonas sp. T1lg75]|uniref:DNA repair protein RecN n=1 Tax=Pseudoalteromonas sp. T1lg75 TaxID=2077102 RepID=UPI000CF67922|nr:DNA repair protein RecN [Pseudoalteromonas sp. T1lg75]
MLSGLTISNFAIVSELETQWHAGMTAITGETGAGKSIAIDALSLCLGERADAAAVRPGAKQADISARFDISRLPKAQQFLQEHMLEGDEQECLLRRVVAKNGRSKSYINGVSVTAAQLKELGQHLLSIHGQHAHQLLLKNDHQLQLLDGYAGHKKLLEDTAQSFSQYQKLQLELRDLEAKHAQQQAQKQLLEYQVAELDEFALEEGEYEQIEVEHNRLSHAQHLLEGSQQQLYALYEGDEQTINGALQHSALAISELAAIDPSLEGIAAMLNDACVQVEEASRELRGYCDGAELDPERLAQLDERLGTAITLARKHMVKPQALVAHHQQIKASLEAICVDDQRLAQLDDEIASALSEYQQCCELLSASRNQAAQELSELIGASMHELSMENGRFAIDLDFDLARTPSRLGLDRIEFLVSTNPGQPMQALSKVASGGELSRISLAIQVIIAQRVTTPTLIFDEVDVGISGPTAAAVGKLLRRLGQSTQVICVTHLPQVASSAMNQFFVAKQVANDETYTQMQALNKQGRVDEIARLLAGDNISKTTLANARELIAAHA